MSNASDTQAGSVRLTVDGIAVEVPAGATVLDACRAAGAHVPTLCYLEGRSHVASCRMCVVKVEGVQGYVASCVAPAGEGMEVTATSPELDVVRKTSLELILADHGLNSTNYCFSCPKNGGCELQALGREFGVVELEFGEKRVPGAAVEPEARKPVVEGNPFLRYDPNLCIACQRCVGACAATGNHTLRAAKRGVRTVIEAPFGPDWKSTGCESCGNCAAACPTGALIERRRETYREWEVSRVLTTCPHCAVGCQLVLKVKDGRIVDAEPANGPSNRALLCVKGRSASFDFVSSPDRLTTPLVRNKVTGELEPASWDEALAAVAEGLGRIKRESGGEALAAFACSRSTNEDIYLFEKMARCALGTNNVDNCARV